MPSLARTHRQLLAGVAALSALVVLAGCGSGSLSGRATSDSATPTADPSTSPAGLRTVRIGAVPTMALGVLEVGLAQGFFRSAGLDLQITPVDSGPNVIVGLAAGEYDLGYTAFAPPLLAQSKGQQLRLVRVVDFQGPAGSNGGVLVRKSSGYRSFTDLAGKKIGTNAPRSLLVLTLQSAIAKAGGKADGLSLIPLPFNQIAAKVADGQLDAGLTLQPYQAQALKRFPELVDLGDSTATALPAGSPSGGLFTSAKTAAKDTGLLTSFRTAYDRAVTYGAAHPAAVRAAGAKLAGLSPTDADTITLGPLGGELTAAGLGPLVDAMIDRKWISIRPDLTAFLAAQA